MRVQGFGFVRVQNFGFARVQGFGFVRVQGFGFFFTALRWNSERFGACVGAW